MVIVDNWAQLDIERVILRPSEQEVAGWKLLSTGRVTLKPSEEEVGGWKLLKTGKITLATKELPPTKEGIPWMWVVIGGLGIAGIILLTTEKKT
jgi:hypothetical protein